MVTSLLIPGMYSDNGTLSRISRISRISVFEQLWDNILDTFFVNIGNGEVNNQCLMWGCYFFAGGGGGGGCWAPPTRLSVMQFPNLWFAGNADPISTTYQSVGNADWGGSGNAELRQLDCRQCSSVTYCLPVTQIPSILLGCSKSFESGNETTFFFGAITFIAQYNLP